MLRPGGPVTGPPGRADGGRQMANEPKPAAEKRADPGERRNAQGDHEGAPHRPEAFDPLNPARAVPPGSGPDARPRRQAQPGQDPRDPQGPGGEAPRGTKANTRGWGTVSGDED